MIVRADDVAGLTLRTATIAVHLASRDLARAVVYLQALAPLAERHHDIVRELARRITLDGFIGDPAVAVVADTPTGPSVFVHGALCVDLTHANAVTTIDGATATTWHERTIEHPIHTVTVRHSAAAGEPAPGRPADTSIGAGPVDPNHTRIFTDDMIGSGSEQLCADGTGGLDADEALTIKRTATRAATAQFDDRTVVRAPGRTPPTVVPAPSTTPDEPVLPPGHVRGLACVNGHPNKAIDVMCRTCGAVLADDLGLTIGPRPPLGWLLVDDGRQIQLTHPCLLGRRPPDDHTSGGEPAMAVHLDDDHHHISQRHVEVQLVGWDVRAVDCGSTNGTRFRRAGSRRAAPLKPHDTQPLEPGDQLEIGQRTITYVERLT